MPASTGTTGRETPAGVFAIIEEDKDHHSSLYDDTCNCATGSPSPATPSRWDGWPLPGYAASHGCVPMPDDFAEKLFDKTWIGMRVIISPNYASPVEISHPARSSERGGRRGCSGACRDAGSRGRGGRQYGRRGEESRRDSGTRGSIARGVAAQARTA